MEDDEETVGYKRPPVHSRFKKGQSGNPHGRPKTVPNFFDDAAIILGAPVTGHANGKPVTLPTMQAAFRSLCRMALKGENAALRRVIDLMLTLEPEAKQKAEQAVDMKKAVDDLATELDRQRAAFYGPDAHRHRRAVPGWKKEMINKQVDTEAKEERKRLIREARDCQRQRR